MIHSIKRTVLITHRRHVARLAIVMAACSVSLTGCLSLVTTPAGMHPADSVLMRRALTETLTEYYQWALTRRPDLAGRLGAVPSRVPLSPEAQSSGALSLSHTVAGLLDGPFAQAFTAEEYLTLQTMRWELDVFAEARAFTHLDFSALSSEYTPLKQYLFLAKVNAFADIEAATAYLELVQSIGLWVDGLRYDFEGRRIEQGVRASKPVVDLAIRDFGRLKSLLAEGALRATEGQLSIVDSASRIVFRAKEDTLNRMELTVAIDSTIAYLERYDGVAIEQAGLWRNPGGREYYRALLRRHTGLEVTPEVVQRVANVQIRRIDSLMRVLRPRILPSATPVVLHDTLRQRLARQPLTMQSLVHRIDSLQQPIRDSIGRYVAPPTGAPPRVRPATALEEYLWPDGAVVNVVGDSARWLLVTQRWLAPDIANGLRGETYRWMWPGRSLSMGIPVLPEDSTLTFLLAHPHAGTRSGWAEYAASLAGEAGLFNDPIDAYAQLMHEGLNAALLTADLGFNYFEWTPQQAMAALQPFTLGTPAQTESLFVRTVLMNPARAAAPLLAGREFAAMRAWIERELGPLYNRPALHRRLVTLGSPPLPALGTYLEWWAWNERRKAAAQQQPAKGKPPG